MIFNFLARLADLEKGAVPFVWTREDRDILISIGAAQENGQPLGLKGLILRKIGTPSTLRRRVAYLIDRGYIEKTTDPKDRRAVVYVVSQPVVSYMNLLGAELLHSLAASAGDAPPPQRSAG